MDKRIENINVVSEDLIITPEELKNLFPLNETAVRTVMEAQHVIKNIIDRKDRRLLVLAGPCSIHDTKAAMEYAGKLRALADEVGDSLYLVMRVYFEKPRTRGGWQGLINDPFLDNSFRIDEGLKMARSLLLDMAKMGLPAAGEALDLITPQYVQDLISWTAIGARTTEAQTHRKMASGFTSAAGFKNATDGNLDCAVNAIHSAKLPSHFKSVDPSGRVAVIRTTGNQYTHIVLRGGTTSPNYGAGSIGLCENTLRKNGLPETIMVDCSHDNSQKKHEKQTIVCKDIAAQIDNGNRSIIGIMIESNLHAGNQPMAENLSDLKYGISITDACMGWPETEKMLRNLRNAVKEALQTR